MWRECLWWGGNVPLALLKIINLIEIDGHFRRLCPNTDFLREMSESLQIMIKLSRTHIEGIWGSGGIALIILNLCTRWRWAVSVTTRPLYLGKEPTVYLKLYSPCILSYIIAFILTNTCTTLCRHIHPYICFDYLLVIIRGIKVYKHRLHSHYNSWFTLIPWWWLISSRNICRGIYDDRILVHVLVRIKAII
jgi:hypothetical protein